MYFCGVLSSCVSFSRGRGSGLRIGFLCTFDPSVQGAGSTASRASFGDSSCSTASRVRLGEDSFRTFGRSTIVAIKTDAHHIHTLDRCVVIRSHVHGSMRVSENTKPQ